MLTPHDELLELERDLRDLSAGALLGDVRETWARQLDALWPPEDISTDQVACDPENGRKLPINGGTDEVPYNPRLTPHLKEVHDALDDPSKRIVAIKGPARSGKALALNTPLATPNGWTTMGDVAVGDRLFDETGAPCTVIFATEVQHDRLCYEVKFSDGSVIIADADHLWSVQWVRRPKPARIPVLATKVLQTRDMIGQVRDGSVKRGRKRYRVRVADILDLPAAVLPIDPYVLGAWLGDGSSRTQELTVHENDIETLKHFVSAGYTATIRERSETGTLRVGITYGQDFTDRCRRGHPTDGARYSDRSCLTCRQQQYRQRFYDEPRDPVLYRSFGLELRDAGLLLNKHVPAAYLRAAPNQRLALLQGLMDTDGTIGRTGSCEFATTTPALRDAVFELVASLGMKPAITVKQPYAVVNGEHRPGAIAYTVRFTAYADQPVFRLARKLARLRLREKGRAGDSGSRRIVDIRPTTSVPVRCIQVDSASHLFLAGRAMIPTHNTIAAENYLLKVGMYGPPRNVLWYMHSEPDVRRYVDERVDFFLRRHGDLWEKRDRAKAPKWNLRRVDGGLWEWLAANDSTTRARSAALIIADEVDAMRPKIRDAWVTLAKNRQREYGNLAKMFIASHPDAGPLFGIDSILVDSDLRVRMGHCPYCAHRIGAAKEVPTERRMVWNLSALMTKGEDMGREELLDFIADAIRLICPHCRGEIDNDQRLEMRFDAEWMGRGQEIDQQERIVGDISPSEIAGFVFHAVDAPFDSLAELAKQFAAAKREFDETGSDANLREVTVKSIGETYTRDQPGSKVQHWKEVKARLVDSGYRLKTVPLGVDFLVAMVDVQGDRFEPGVIGWSRTLESWLIDRYATRQLEGFHDIRPGERLSDWDVLESVLTQTYPLNDGSGDHLPIACLCIDTGGVPGVTDNARKWVGKMISRYPEPIPQWRLRLLKGDAHTKGELIGRPREIKLDAADRPLDVPVLERTTNVHELKLLLANRREVEEPGPLRMHLPNDVTDAQVRELVSETLVNGAWIARGRNELWDIWVGAEVGRRLMAPDSKHIDWQAPPIWAQRFKPSQDGMIGGMSRPEQDFMDRLRQFNRRRARSR